MTTAAWVAWAAWAVWTCNSPHRECPEKGALRRPFSFALRPPRYNPSPANCARFPGACPQGQVAQLVEQRTENPRVGGSIPPLATNIQILSVISAHLPCTTVGKT